MRDVAAGAVKSMTASAASNTRGGIAATIFALTGFSPATSPRSRPILSLPGASLPPATHAAVRRRDLAHQHLAHAAAAAHHADPIAHGIPVPGSDARAA